MSLVWRNAKVPKSVATLRDRVEKVLPLVEKHAAEAEQLGHLTDNVVLAMREAGVYSMLYPEAVGGPELAHVDALEIVERIARTHASAGWCVMVNNMEGAAMAAYLEDQGVADIFGNGADVTVAGNGVPRGYARPVDGGYMIRGKWAYGSAIQHAEWIHSGCFVTGADGKSVRDPGQPEIVIAHHPRSTVRLNGNWNVLGLRATGSYDYTLDDAEELFVPLHRCYDFDLTTPRRGKAQGSLGLTGYSAWAHTGWGLGVGRRMLDELADLVVRRTDRFGKSSESASLKFQFAQAEARYRAARALTYETWQGVADTFASGSQPTLEQMTIVKLCLRHVHDVASDVATFAHRNARGASLYDTVMQRFYRDVHSGTQHIMMADQIVEECGRALLGLPGPGAFWRVFSVIG